MLHDIRLWLTAALMVYTGTLVAAQGNEGEAQKRGSVTGIVVESKSDEPVRKAVVILRSEQGTGIGTTTDATGKFKLLDLEPGTYTLTASRDGYVVVARKSQRKVVVVKADETTSDLKLELLRTGTISGRILDADGDPITGAGVQVLPLHSQRTGLPGGSYATTNDRGEYRAFNIAPGDYRVSVTYTPETQHMEIRMQQPASSDGRSTGETYPTVYYPGTIDARQATVVTVEPGTELQGFDVQLMRARGVRVRGRVTGSMDNNSAPFFVMIALEPVGSRGEIGAGQPRNTLVRDPKGEFELTDVLPGTYRISAMGAGFNQENRLTVRQTLEIGESDIDGVQLSMGQAQKVSGHIIAPEGRKVSSALMIMLASREPGDTQGGGMAQVGAGGNFTMKDVAPGNYDVIVASSGDVDDSYISAIRLGDTDVLAEGIHIGEGLPGSLDIILKANGGTAECTVKNETGEAVPDVHVILVPDVPRQRQVALYGDCRTQAGGTCTIVGITPGKYHAYAFPTEIAIDYRDADALKPYETYGKTVKLGEGDRLQLELNAVPVE